MKNYEEIINMFNLQDEKVYFTSKGIVDPSEVIITEDYLYSECSGILSGSELEGYIILREGKELTIGEYGKFSFSYIDKTERYNESGDKYSIDKSYKYYNKGVNLTGCEVYVLYKNFNNNDIDSYNVDIYTIK